MCNIYPLKPHFHIEKLGYAGVYLFFLFLLQNVVCGYSLEPPQRVPTIYVLSKNKKNIRKIPNEILEFLQPKQFLFISWACFRNEQYFSCLDTDPILQKL